GAAVPGQDSACGTLMPVVEGNLLPPVHLPASLLHRILTHAEEAYPGECCGLLLGEASPERGRIVRSVEPIPNPAIDEGQLDRYRIDPADYLRIDRRARAKGWEIVGCYHSHPDEEPVPSATDLAGAWPWYA